jgi:hypothetical protein
LAAACFASLSTGQNVHNLGVMEHLPWPQQSSCGASLACVIPLAISNQNKFATQKFFLFSSLFTQLK